MYKTIIAGIILGILLGVGGGFLIKKQFTSSSCSKIDRSSIQFTGTSLITLDAKNQNVLCSYDVPLKKWSVFEPKVPQATSTQQ